MYPRDNAYSEISYDKPISDRALKMIPDQAGALFCVVSLLFCTRFGDVLLQMTMYTRIDLDTGSRV